MNVFAEKTLAIIKPDSVKYSDQIEWTIMDAGFSILNKNRIHLTEEQVTDFFRNQEDDEGFNKIVEYMTSGPIVVMVLTKNNVVEEFLNFIGPKDPVVARRIDPKCIRALYGTDSLHNAIYSSLTNTDAKREIEFFFSNVIIDPLAEHEEIKLFFEKELYPVLTLGLTQLCKEKPEDPVVWLGNWLLKNNPNTPVIVESENSESSSK